MLFSIISCNEKAKQDTNKLMIPELIDSRAFNRDIQLTLQNGQHEFYPNIKSNTKGFNGHYLGPTIRFYKNESTRIRFTNKIGESTTVHGHGLHVEGKVDGGPHNKILPNQTWDIILPIKQEASTNWYHPHLMGKTAEHVHAGLAGLYIIEDDNSLKLPLPKTYGVDDIPLVIQDRDFTNGKMVDYSITEEENMQGKREGTLIVNGTVSPYVKVPKGWLRLRLLNGSNARIYDFHLKSKQPFYKIATEGGFLEHKQTNHGSYVVTEWNYRGPTSPNYMIVKDGWKLMVPYTEDSKVINAMYHLTEDPHEMNNLLGENPERGKYEQKAEELRTNLLEWLKKTNSIHYLGVSKIKLI